MSEVPRTRRFPRIPAEHTVLIRPLVEPGDESFAKTRVVGLGGCMFMHPGQFGVGTRVEMLISVTMRVVRAVARIVYELPVGDASYEIGVEFLEIADEDRAVLEALFGRTADTAV